MIKQAVLSLVLWATTLAQATGFYEVRYEKKPGKQVAIAIAGGSVGPFESILVADSTDYYVGFVGYSGKLGPVSVTPYVGLEDIKGVTPQARGSIVASTKIGPLSVMTVNEFGGVTGNLHHQRLWLDHGPYGLGLVRHRFNGFGPRFDYRLGGGTAVYLEYQWKDDTPHLRFAVSGTF